MDRAGRPHLLKRTYADPHWNERVAQVWAFERVSLFGLELFPRRHVHYGPIEPVLSREIFIHHALIEGQYWSNAPFARHNRELVAQVDALQARLRRRDFMLDIAARYAFFDKRLPANIYSGQAFEPWLRGEQKRDPKSLHMSLDDLLVTGAGDSAASLKEQYPDAIEIEGTRLPLSYRFELGHPEDGVTVIVPLATLGHLTHDLVEWLVPGMLAEKLTALMRTLPKDLRRAMVPVPDFAARAEKSMTFARGSLTQSLAETLGGMIGTRIDPSLFDTAAIDQHLIMNIRIIDSPVEAGPTDDAPTTSSVAQAPDLLPLRPTPAPKILALGRDLRALQAQFRSAIQASLAAEERSPWNREGIASWDFGELPERVEVVRGGVTFPAYPAVIDPCSQPGRPRMPRPTSVWLRLMDRQDVAAQATRLGLRRLFAIQTREELRFQVANLPSIDKMLLSYGSIGDPKEFKEDLADLIADQVFLAGPSLEGDVPRTKARFDQRLDAGWHRLTEAALRSGKIVGSILAMRQSLALRCPDAVAPLDAPLTSPASWHDSMRDIRLQMANLTQPGFISGTPFDWLGHLPRYLQAVERRVHKLSSGGQTSVERDRRLTEEVRPLWLECLRKAQILRSEGRTDPSLVEFRWLIEEYRVSLFAQELGTSCTVSAKRLAAKLDQLQDDQPRRSQTTLAR